MDGLTPVALGHSPYRESGTLIHALTHGAFCGTG